MNRQGHVIFTILFTAIAVYAQDRYYVALPYTIMALGITEAVFVSALPDTFEPGGRSDHRGGFHSWRALAVCLLLCGTGVYIMPSNLWYYHALFFLPWGYATHLLADALSPSGLPF